MLFNNSKYFVRNGDGIANGTWTIGNTRLNTEVPQEQWESVLRHFNIQNDVQGKFIAAKYLFFF